jgi:hypothetical protein
VVVQLTLEEASAGQAPLEPDAAASAAAELAAAMLIPGESSTASLAEFEQEIAEMLSQCGAASGSSNNLALQHSGLEWTSQFEQLHQAQEPSHPQHACQRFGRQGGASEAGPGLVRFARMV